MNGSDALAVINSEDDMAIVSVDTTALAVISRSEIETQIACAHKYPRSVKRFVNEAITLATLTKDVAESCIYALPRGGKTLAGPSVRLAEICASAYGNLHVAARVLDAEQREVVAQGMAHDLEKNLRVTVEARRRITNKSGKRYDDDMITVTGAAAGSIALRNAIFRVVPRAYIDTIYAKVREVAVGNASTLAARRAEVVSRLQKIGVPIERIFVRVEKTGIEDVGLEELEVLIGLGTAIKNGDRTIDEAFPPTAGASQATKDLEAELRAKAANGAPPADPKPEAKTLPEPNPLAAVTSPSEPASEPASVKHDADGVVSEATSGERLPDWATTPTDPIKKRGK